MSARSVSIVICSANRAAALAQTLDEFRRVHIPSEWEVELVVVDNASIDNTKAVVEEFHRSDMVSRYIYEPRKGKGNALNTGISAARGEVLLFTDDDVRPFADWIEKLAAPLFLGQADAVGGRILLAPYLLRPWLSDPYRSWLAWCETPDPMYPLELIGANMGMRRQVLQSVPAFDPELGPGAAGLGEDTLLSWQLAKAGHTIEFLPEAVVVHHPDESRLQRASWLKMAESHGRKEAYILHHWKHEVLRVPSIKLAWLQVKLALRRLLQPPGPPDGEGCARWEMSYVGDIEMCRMYIRHRRRERNYTLRGLKRLDYGAPLDQ